MRFSLAGLGLLIITDIIAVTIVPAKDRDSHQPIAWCYVQEGPLELMQKALGRRTKPLSLGRGALAPVVKIESKNGRTRALLRITDLATLNPVDVWVDTSKVEIVPIDRFPSDEELLRQLGVAVIVDAGGVDVGNLGRPRPQFADKVVESSRHRVRSAGG